MCEYTACEIREDGYPNGVCERCWIPPRDEEHPQHIEIPSLPEEKAGQAPTCVEHSGMRDNSQDLRVGEK